MPSSTPHLVSTEWIVGFADADASDDLEIHGAENANARMRRGTLALSYWDACGVRRSREGAGGTHPVLIVVAFPF